jgi:hypothetical protein
MGNIGANMAGWTDIESKHLRSVKSGGDYLLRALAERQGVEFTPQYLYLFTENNNFVKSFEEAITALIPTFLNQKITGGIFAVESDFICWSVESLFEYLGEERITTDNMTLETMYSIRWLEQQIRVLNLLVWKYEPWSIINTSQSMSIWHQAYSDWGTDNAALYNAAVSGMRNSVPVNIPSIFQSSTVWAQPNQGEFGYEARYYVSSQTSIGHLFAPNIYSNRGLHACGLDIYFHFVPPISGADTVVFDGGGKVIEGLNLVDTIAADDFNDVESYKWKWDARDYVPSFFDAPGDYPAILHGYILDHIIIQYGIPTYYQMKGGIVKKYDVPGAGYEFIAGS